MNLPWDHYDYSEPFLVKTGPFTGRYFMWRRNLRTGQYTLKGAGLQSVELPVGSYPSVPNPLECFPPLEVL